MLTFSPPAWATTGAGAQSQSRTPSGSRAGGTIIEAVDDQIDHEVIAVSYTHLTLPTKA